MIVIDFNGMPGCGKSTIAKELYNNLVNVGKVNYYCNPLSGKKPWKKIGFFFYYLFTGMGDAASRKLLAHLVKLEYHLMKKNGRKGLRSLEHFLKVYLIYRYYKEQRSKNCSILIIDQGVTQELMSGILVYQYDKEKIKAFFDQLDIFTDWMLVEVELELESNLKRLSMRKEGKSRLDHVSQEETERMVQCYSEGLTCVRTSYQCFDHIVKLDSTLASPKENAQIIIVEVQNASEN